MTKVSLIKGEDRYQNISSALKEIEKETASALESKKNIVLKPNFVSTGNQLAATHVDTVRAILDFVTSLTDEEITIAESPAVGSARQGYKNFDYLSLPEEYPVTLKDLGEGGYEKTTIFDRNLEPTIEVGVSKILLDADFIISPAMLKTHDSVIVTLSLKNILVGSLDHKSKVHQGPRAINRSLAKLAEMLSPDLSVIDGFLGMEGNGPVHGSPIKMQVALAGLDFLSVDTLGSTLMGFNPEDVGYLHFCRENRLGVGDLSKIEIVGNTEVSAVKKNFKPHSSYKSQLNWR